jgi:hypothetical protein
MELLSFQFQGRCHRGSAFAPFRRGDPVAAGNAYHGVARVAVTGDQTRWRAYLNRMPYLALNTIVPGGGDR